MAFYFGTSTARISNGTTAAKALFSVHDMQSDQMSKCNDCYTSAFFLRTGR